MKRAALVAFALTGCYRPGAEISCTVQCNTAHPCEGGLSCELGLCRDPLGPACSDAGLDDAMRVDVAISTNCWGAVPHQFCQTPAPTGMLDIAVRTSINTDSDPLCTTLPGYPYCVIAYQDIVIRAHVEGFGSKPLIFVATNDLAINGAGEVDVSALGFPLGGPGAGGSACAGGTSGSMGLSSSGGGAGGTFAGLGGAGGAGSTGAGGQPVTTVTPNPSTVRGGCGGTNGGSAGGTAGAGGGAVVLIAGNNLSVAGNVLARGRFGAGGASSSGGGGGGSGGLIVLDGTNVHVSSSLIAGGGGGGGGGTADGPGGDGGVTSTMGTAATGGAGAPSAAEGNGGPGGVGSGSVVMPLNGGTGTTAGFLAGGGGGGGGAGVIQIRGVLTNQGATIVPPRT